jgi:hypothetical protein
MNRVLEQNLVQRVIKWSSAVIELSGNLMKVAQAGSTQAYLMMMVFALFVGLAWFLFGVGQYGSY